MSKIIKCDFKRTERRKRMEEIMFEIQELAEENGIDLSNIMESNEFFAKPEALKLQYEYADLCEEEKEWGDCKNYK